MRRNCLGWGDASTPEASAAAGGILPQLPLNLARRKRATTKFPAYALALLLCVLHVQLTNVNGAVQLA